MNERLKKLKKLEKNEKGHNAMTEELRKMEEETGLSVSVHSVSRRLLGGRRTVLPRTHDSFFCAGVDLVFECTRAVWAPSASAPTQGACPACSIQVIARSTTKT